MSQAPTAFALSMTTLCLLHHPDELARLRAQPDLLRRFATCRTGVNGVTIEAGQ